MEEKGKAITLELYNPSQASQVRVKVPNTDALIRKHSLTLTGRVTNITIQKFGPLFHSLLRTGNVISDQ